MVLIASSLRGPVRLLMATSHVKYASPSSPSPKPSSACSTQFTGSTIVRNFSAAAGKEGTKGSSKDPPKLPIDLRNIPEKPRLPRSPQAIYFDHRFEEMKKDQPDLKKSDAKKIIDQEWEKLEMKQPYEELSKKEQDDYKDKREVYKEFINRKITVKEMLAIMQQFQKFESKKAKELKESRPKKAPSAYILFVKEYTEERRAGGHGPPNLKEIGEAWRSLSESAKQNYQERSAKFRQESAEALKEWKDHQ